MIWKPRDAQNRSCGREKCKKACTWSIRNTRLPSTPLSSLRRSSRAAQRALMHLYDIKYQCSYILWVQANDSHSKMHAYRRFITYSLTQTPYLPPMQRHTLEHAKRARSAHGASRRPRHGAAMPKAAGSTRLRSLSCSFGGIRTHRCCNGHG